jgi:hypothetical protein
MAAIRRYPLTAVFGGERDDGGGQSRLSDFDELIICVERTERIEYFADKARSQVQGNKSAEPTTVAEYKQLHDAIRDIQSDARARSDTCGSVQLYKHGV